MAVAFCEILEEFGIENKVVVKQAHKEKATYFASTTDSWLEHR